MLSFIVRRFLLALVTIWAISVLSFIIIQLPPGDFVDAYIARLSASGSSVSMEEAQALRKLYGLDQPYLRPVLEMDRSASSPATSASRWNGSGR